MTIVNLSKFRENLKMYLDETIETKKPIVVTRPGGENVIVLSKKEFDSIAETLYLFGNRANARALLEAMGDVDAGRTINMTDEFFKPKKPGKIKAEHRSGVNKKTVKKPALR